MVVVVLRDENAVSKIKIRDLCLVPEARRELYVQQRQTEGK
jgi:hypothetical protein